LFQDSGERCSLLTFDIREEVMITNEINDINEVDEDIPRVMAILCVDNEEDMKVIDENLGEYFGYLDENIYFSGVVTCIEDFR